MRSIQQLFIGFVLILGLVMASFAQQAQPTPYQLIENQTPNELANIDPAEFARCMQVIVPDNMELGYPLHDSLQIYGDCKNVQPSGILLNQAGYLPDMAKMFYVVGASGTAFSIIDESGAEVGSGTLTNQSSLTTGGFSIRASNNAQLETGGDTRYTVSGGVLSGTFSVGYIPEGLDQDKKYRIKVGTKISADFIISEKVYSMVKDAVLKFFGVNRSGDSQNWFHDPSHLKDGLPGGWYDCGDHLKESQTQSYAAAVLGTAAAVFQDRDTDHYGYNQGNTTNTDGIGDILREAKHGVDYIVESYDMNGGVVAGMITSVGTFGEDHSWWGSPEFQDGVPKELGGPVRELRSELFSTVVGRYAAAAAFVGKLYEQYDPTYSAKALKVAKDLYEYGKANGAKYIGDSPAYNGDNSAEDDLALAAIALAWATAEQTYFDDVVRNTSLGTKDEANGAMWTAGWFAAGSGNTFSHEDANTSWANIHPVAIWALYKLILRDETYRTAFNIGNDEAQQLMKFAGMGLAFNLDIGDGVGSGGFSVPVPKNPYAGSFTGSDGRVAYGDTWFDRKTDQDWIWNRYQFGNITESFLYWDVARELESINMAPIYIGANAGVINYTDGNVSDWNAAAAGELYVNQMNFMLGMNEWDISMIMGVGDKNQNHPHHRAANPEGKNVPGAFYQYRIPHGGLTAGYPPGNTWSEHYDNYHNMEVCLDGATTALLPAVGLAGKEDLLSGPKTDVKIEYVGYDKVIITILQDKFGGAELHFGTNEDSLTNIVIAPGMGIEHTIEINAPDISPATTYYFTVFAQNNKSLAVTQRNLDTLENDDGTTTIVPYSFTTLSTPPADANITNVKVCNLEADSAEIMWYTPNGEYGSKIYWSEQPISDPNAANVSSLTSTEPPSKFHIMQIGVLKEKTKYYYMVESDGQQRAVDENGAALTFTTPVEHVGFDIKTHTYGWNGSDDAFSIVIVNEDVKSYDSLEARIYVRAPEYVKSSLGTDVLFSDHFAWRADIGIVYNEAGYQDATLGGRLSPLLQAAHPVKMEDTYYPSDGTYAYYIPIPLGDTEMASGSRIRLDLLMDSRSPYPPYTDIMNVPPSGIPVRTGTDVNGDGITNDYAIEQWSFGPKSVALGHLVDFAGIPAYPKDFADNGYWMLPSNPYVTIYRKEQFVYGFSPSYAEMTTKRAHYDMDLTLDAPFDVPSGTYVELDQGSSRFIVTGEATITEGGWITDIWVNGEKLEDIYGTGIVTKNTATSVYSLNIPVSMKIGANDIDITIFAGPEPFCEDCIKNGGCAFENRNFFIQFSKGDFTASNIVVTRSDGSSIASPIDIGSDNVEFVITVIDLDKKGSGSLDVLVINSRKEDTLSVTLKETATKGTFKLSSPIKSVQKDASETGSSEIAFFGADTIYVRYTDLDDPEDISEASFYAKQTYPVPNLVKALDPNCTGKATDLEVKFSTAFSEGDRLDSMWVSIKDPITLEGDSFFVFISQEISGKSKLTIPLPNRSTIPKTTAPTGYIGAYIQADGQPRSSVETAPIKDGILPFVIGFSILENLDPRVPQDTVMIGFSESVDFSADLWPFVVKDADGNDVDISSIVLHSSATTNNDGKSWLFSLDGNTNGELLKSGYIASISSVAQIFDNSGNQLDPDGCNSSVEIIEVPKPAAVKIAEMRDLNEDAYPDELFIKFERKLRPDKDMLDSFLVDWGLPSQIVSYTQDKWIANHTFETSTREEAIDSVTTKTITDSVSIITINIEKGDFDEFTSTTGYANGKGELTPRLGPEGGFFDVSYSVSDLVGPRIVDARLGGRNDDSLGIVFSEQLDTIADGSYYVEKKRSGVITQLVADQALNLRSLKSIYFMGQDKNTPSSLIRVGDSLRIATVGSKFKDAFGNLPGENNPWVIVQGALKTKIELDVEMKDDISQFTKTEVEEAYPEDLADDEHFRVSILKPRTGLEAELAKGKGKVDFVVGATVDTSAWKNVGPTFISEIAIPTSMAMAAGSYVWDVRVKFSLFVYDALGQFVTEINSSFNLNEDMRSEFVDLDGVIYIKVEWLVHNLDAPRAFDGRAVGNGPYVSKTMLDVKTQFVGPIVEEEDENGNIIASEYEIGDRKNSNLEDIVKFGVMRPSK